MLPSVPGPHPLPAVWQWSAVVPGPPSPETDDLPRAFLWIPETCARVRAVVLAQHNMEEEPILEHALFRDALRDLGFAAIWVTPPFDLAFRFDQGAGDDVDALLAALAAASGYTELVHVPVVPLGHSAAASFPWNFAAWAPARTLAVVSVSGQWPMWSDPSMPPWGDRTVDGIPGLVTIGEYEWADQRAADGLKLRAAHAALPLTLLAEAGAGHFDVSEEKVAYLALYLRKAAACRLPPDPAPDAPPAAARVALRPVDPTVDGWLVDRWRRHDLPRVPAAPVAEYAEPDEAFWCFDAEHARATEKFRADQHGKQVALLGFVQNGVVLPQEPGAHHQVAIPWRPLADGVTFRLSAAWLDTVPQGRPERWTGRKAGERVAHPPAGIGPAPAIDRICGPVERLAPDTFRLRFQRVGLANRKRSAEIWFAATHPGDATFRRAVQQAVLRVPLRHLAGAPQTITFAPIPDQPAGTRTLRLVATTNAPDAPGVGSPAPVRFYVREGPAFLRDDTTLEFTPLPPRARRPARVTVVAWQHGRAEPVALQTAAPIERSFLLLG